MVNYQIIISAIGATVGVAGFFYGRYEHGKVRRPDLRIKLTPIMTHVEIIIINVGSLSTLMSADSGIILPNRKPVTIRHEGDSPSYLIELAPNERLVRLFHRGFINRGLLDAGYEGNCLIKYYVFDEAGRMYTSEKDSFVALDIKKAFSSS